MRSCMPITNEYLTFDCAERFRSNVCCCVHPHQYYYINIKSAKKLHLCACGPVHIMVAICSLVFVWHFQQLTVSLRNRFSVVLSECVRCTRMHNTVIAVVISIGKPCKQFIAPLAIWNYITRDSSQVKSKSFLIHTSFMRINLQLPLSSSLHFNLRISSARLYFSLHNLCGEP